MQVILDIVKSTLGIRTDKRDDVLMHNIKGIVSELEYNHGIKDIENPVIQAFVIDYAVYRYQASPVINTTQTQQQLSMPRNLQYRLHNIIIKMANDVG